MRTPGVTNSRPACSSTVEMLPESETVFFVKELNARITLIRNDEAVTHFLFNWDNQQYVAKKLR
jgi:hypothetical protein